MDKDKVYCSHRPTVFQSGERQCRKCLWCPVHMAFWQIGQETVFLVRPFLHWFIFPAYKTSASTAVYLHIAFLSVGFLSLFLLLCMFLSNCCAHISKSLKSLVVQWHCSPNTTTLKYVLWSWSYCFPSRR